MSHSDPQPTNGEGARSPAKGLAPAVQEARPPTMSVSVLTEEQLRELLGRAVEPLLREIAELKAAQRAEAVTIAEAARRLSVSTRTIQRRVRDGSLPSILVGHSRRIPLASLLLPAPGAVSMAAAHPEG